MAARSSQDATAVDRAEHELRVWLEQSPGHAHLHIKRRGSKLTLCNDSSYGPVNHARFDRIGPQQWQLVLPRHTGRWERTPFSGSLRDVYEVLTSMLGFRLAPR